MKCPKVVIDLFGRNLSMKVMEIEQYVDELRLPLNPTQLERLKRMNRSIKARCQRIKQAWREHNPNVDRTDADIIKLLGGVVDENEAEVIETLEASNVILQRHKNATNPRYERIQGNEDPGGERPSIKEA